MSERTKDDGTGATILREASAFGVDLTLLVENLRRSPTERIRHAQQALDSVLALRSEADAWRRRKATVSGTLEALLELRGREPE